MNWSTISVLSPGISAGGSLWFDERGAFLILTSVVALSAAVVLVSGLLSRRGTARIVWRAADGGGRAVASGSRALVADWA